MGTRYVPVEESRESGGDGFFSFLTKLEWIRNAELENAKPFVVETLRTNHYIYIATKGMGMGALLHGIAVFLIVSSLILSWFYAPLKYFAFLAEAYLLAVKILFPLWFVRSFVTFEHGLTSEIVKIYLVGFSLTSFFYDFVSAFITFMVVIFGNSFYGVGYEMYDEIIYPFIFTFFNLHSLAMWGVNMIVDCFGLFYFYRYRRSRKYTLPIWTPMDDVPTE